MFSSYPELTFPFLGMALVSVLDLFGINSSFCVPLLSETMETSASRTAEKKDKMDGSSFDDLPKKPSPSESRGNTLFKTFSEADTGSEFRAQMSAGPLCAVYLNESRSRRCSARGQRGNEQDQ